MTKDDCNIVELLSRLRTLGVELHAEKDKLRIDAPKGVLNSSVREELIRRKSEILRFLADSTYSSPRDVLSLERVPRDGALRVSFSQERLWFLFQFEPESVAYNLPLCVRMKGRLRINILEKSISEITRRHEALRTSFAVVDGQPVQVISAPSAFSIQTVDLLEFSEADRKQRVQRIAVEEVQRQFDLSKGPLFRAILLRLAQEEHHLIVVMHHIITDGWSLAVFMRELESLYRAFWNGQPSPLRELPVQYADYAHCQREWFQSKVLEKQVLYWKQQLSGDLPVLQLPADRPRPAVQTYRGARKWFVLSKQLTDALTRLSQNQGTTLFMTLLAAFNALLCRYTGQTDFAVGTPIANRNRTELEELIGFFVNTLVLRTDLSGDPRFVDLLASVKETTLSALANQDVPFEQVVGAINPNRDMSYSPLFQVMFALQNFPWAPIDLQELTLTPDLTDAETSMLDLTLYMWEEEKGLSGSFEYNTDLFNGETVSQWADHFRTLLESVVSDPFRRLSELGFMTESERNQILVGWNETAVVYPKDKCFNELFEEQVVRTPDAIAVICANQSLTYRELNGRANQVANYLRGVGAQPDSIVGICTERSNDMVVGLLGILKSGAAYMPLDPHFPEDRIEYMLKDSNSRILITESRLQGNIKGYSGATVCIDSDWSTISKEENINPTVLAGPTDLAYVIYTSGSTGRPKGVQISHRALVNFLCSMRQEPGLTAEDTVLSVTTMSFDIFGLELFLTLLTGAKVILAERNDALDGSRLSELIRIHQVSLLQATPPTWRFLIASGWHGSKSLRAICGGEALPTDLVGPLLDRCKELWNLYGPTETTIWSTAYRVRTAEDPILIGRPIANTSIYILDSSLQPTPVGVAGELHIGGDGLARGYLNRPELTAEKFIHHPFSVDPMARVYKTGDLARYRHDGTIECLGRIDQQVKVRGHRIELGEIEARIKESEAVSNCVVVLREDRPGDQRLVAYYVPEDDHTVSVSEIRRHLHAKLPDYMVPQHFVELASIPLTPNGKVDRRSLPKPDVEKLARRNYMPPQTEMEHSIAAIWQHVLKVEKVGVHDNFFDLGGHSLLMTQVLSKVREISVKEISMMALFQYPTIDSLCKYLGGGEDETSSAKQIHERARRQEETIMRQKELRKVQRQSNE